MKGPRELAEEAGRRAAWALHQVDTIGKARVGTMADRASWEWARHAVKNAQEAAHQAHLAGVAL